MPPEYTVFGTIDQTGLATLDKIAAGGVEPGPTSRCWGLACVPIISADMGLLPGLIIAG